MSVALAGRSPSTFDLKSANLPLLELRLKSSELDVLAEELQAQYGDMPDFFEDDGVVLDLAQLPAEQAEAVIDFQRVGELLHERRLRLLAVRGGSAQQQADARALGLLLAPEVRVQAPSAAPAADATLPTADSAATAPEPPPPGALVIDRPLRSGQQVYARGRDLVLLAMVNPGAEVIADGHIHVYAPLRGRAIAGARGWAEARIFARDMRPDLVSIAGVYRTGDDPLPDTVWGRAASVRLASSEAGDKLIFEPIE